MGRPADFKRDVEGEFEPNLTNSVIFQLMAATHASSFLANYDGHPFMMPLTTNKPLLYSLSFFLLMIFATGSEAIPELNELLSLVPCPTPEFRQRILMLLVADIGLSVGLSQAVGALAVYIRGGAAERIAREQGLGLADDIDREDKKSSSKNSKVPKEPKEPKEKKEKKT